MKHCHRDSLNTPRVLRRINDDGSPDRRRRDRTGSDKVGRTSLQRDHDGWSVHEYG